MTTGRPTDWRSLAGPVMVAGITLTAAAVLWVALASQLAATGGRIDALLNDRRELLRERAAARVTLAQASDPVLREERAREMGFGPPTVIEMLAVPARTSAGKPIGRSDAPLSMVVPQAPPSAVSAPWRWLSLPHHGVDQRLDPEAAPADETEGDAGR